MEKEALFKSVFYGMCNAEINQFMQTYTETNVTMYPYDAKVLGNLLIRTSNGGYDVHLTCESDKDDVIVVKYTHNTALIFGLSDDNWDDWDSVLDWDNIYGILQSNEDAMKFVLENTDTEIHYDDDLNALYWFENRDETHKFYEDAIQSLDVAIKGLRECAEILHNLKF